MVGEGEGGRRVGTNGEGELEWEAEVLSAHVCQGSGKVSALFCFLTTQKVTLPVLFPMCL